MWAVLVAALLLTSGMEKLGGGALEGAAGPLILDLSAPETGLLSVAGEPFPATDWHFPGSQDDFEIVFGGSYGTLELAISDVTRLKRPVRVLIEARTDKGASGELALSLDVIQDEERKRRNLGTLHFLGLGDEWTTRLLSADKPLAEGDAPDSALVNLALDVKGGAVHIRRIEIWEENPLPPGEIIVVDCSGVSRADLLTLRALQGRMNRHRLSAENAPDRRIALITGGEYMTKLGIPQSTFWIEYYCARYSLQPVFVTPHEMLKSAGPIPGGAVQFDPETDYSAVAALNAAVSLDAVPVAKGSALLEALQLEVALDLSDRDWPGVADPGRESYIPTKAKAYEWMNSEMWSLFQRGRVLMLPDDDWTLADMAFFLGCPAFDMDPLDGKSEGHALDLILKTLGGGAEAIGGVSGKYAGTAGDLADAEESMLKRLSENGLWLVPARGATNLSFHGTVFPPARSDAPRAEPSEPDSRKAHLALLVTGGGDLGALLGPLTELMLEEPWQSPAGLVVPGAARVYAPAAFDFVRARAENRPELELVLGPSGCGAVYPHLIPAEQRDLFSNRTAELMDLSGVALVQQDSAIGGEFVSGEALSRIVSIHGIMMQGFNHGRKRPGWAHVYLAPGEREVPYAVEKLDFGELERSKAYSKLRGVKDWGDSEGFVLGVWDIDSFDAEWWDGFCRDLKSSWLVMRPSDYLNSVREIIGTSEPGLGGLAPL